MRMKEQRKQCLDVYKRQNINSANKNNVIGAYAIAYHEDGTQTAIVIDKDRIERAMNAAQTKIVWNNDYKKMVLKTVIHELYKELSKFNVIPDELQEDYQEMIMNKEEVQAEIDANANSEVFEADFSVKDEPHHINPVSYTHLDVYKRQIREVICFEGVNRKNKQRRN